jgi:hypothetical protein
MLSFGGDTLLDAPVSHGGSSAMQKCGRIRGRDAKAVQTQSTRCKTSPVAGRSDAKSLGESADSPFKNIFGNFGFSPELRDVFPGEPQIWDIRIQSENDLACFDHVIWRYRRALDAPGSNASRHPCAARETISPGQAVNVFPVQLLRGTLHQHDRAQLRRAWAGPILAGRSSLGPSILRSYSLSNSCGDAP